MSGYPKETFCMFFQLIEAFRFHAFSAKRSVYNHMAKNNTRNSQVRHVFSVNLNQLHLTPDGSVPSFLPSVREYIINECHNEGIFRKCGNFSTIQQLGNEFAQNNCQIPSSASVFEVADFLKQWLNSLPEPLITPNIAAQFLKNNTNDPKSAVETLRHLNSLNRRTAAYIFSIIKAVLKQSNINKMHFGNIQSCFVTSLTQSQRGYPNYQFSLLYNVGSQLLNQDETDFILQGPVLDQLLSQPLKPIFPPIPKTVKPAIPVAVVPKRIKIGKRMNAPVAQTPSFNYRSENVSDFSSNENAFPPHGKNWRMARKLKRFSLPIGEKVKIR